MLRVEGNSEISRVTNNRGPNSWRLFSLFAAVSVLAVSLTGCSFLSPESDRDDLLASIEQSLSSGDGEALCISLNMAVPDSCGQQILSSSGMGDVDISNFALTETSARHSFVVSGFSLVLESELIDFEDGSAYVFDLVELKIPLIALPFGGSLGEVALAPGEEYRIMPALAPAEFKPSEPAHGFLSVTLVTAPWVNQYPVKLEWSPNLEDLMKTVVATECSQALKGASYEIFKPTRFSGEYINFDSPFRRAETYVDSIFEDDTTHDAEVRVINSPKDLSFDSCEVGELTIGETTVTSTWLASASFRGTVGVKTSRNTFMDDYTGRYKALKFKTIVAGSTTLDFTYNSAEPEISTSDISSRLPLKTSKD